MAALLLECYHPQNMEMITQQEIDATLQEFENLTEKDVEKLMRTFQKKQEPLLVYTAAVAQREDLNEEEYDLLVTMILLVWQVMRKRFPRIKKVSIEQIDEIDDQLYERLETDPDSLKQTDKHPQAALLSNVHTAILEAESEVREDSRGLIFFTTKNVLDALIQASETS